MAASRARRRCAATRSGCVGWGGAFATRLTQPPPLPAGKRFFEELDRDNDGRVKLEDLKICMRCARKRSRYMQRADHG